MMPAGDALSLAGETEVDEAPAPAAEPASEPSEVA